MDPCFSNNIYCKLFGTFILFLVAFSNLYQAFCPISGEADLKMYEVEIGRRVIALFPFTVTVLFYILSSWVFPDAKKVEHLFQDFYTFLGLPLTCLGFINIILHYITSNTSSYLIPEIPVASLAYGQSKSSIHLANFLAVLQLPALILLISVSNCLVKFRPQIPILIFNSLFLGVVLDRLSRKEDSLFGKGPLFNSSDIQFCYSLGFQVFLIDVIFVALSRCTLEKNLPCAKSPISIKADEIEAFPDFLTSAETPVIKSQEAFCDEKEQLEGQFEKKEILFPGKVLIDI